MSRPTLVVGLALALLTAAVPALGFHSGAEEDPSRDVTFDAGNMNEWWVEVYLGGSEAGNVVSVEARDTNGPWVELTKRDWGAWAASFHVEAGHSVQFAALLDSGVFVQSCWFSHPEGAKQCQEEGGSTAPGGLSASFDTPGGNEWWVEVYVDAPAPLSGVEARADEGPWHALEKKSWGAWAKSFHVADGSLVQFRATSTDGDTALSGKYVWPEGTPVGDGGAGGAPEELRASFETPGGNEWWVEVYVDASAPLSGVDARVEGGEWHALSNRDWGAWAKSFHVADGSLVQFRATSTDGDTALSGEYRWPGGEKVSDAPGGSTNVWPSEGSYVKYEVHSGGGAPDGSYQERTDVNVTLEYVNGAWQAACEGWSRTWRYDYETDERRLTNEDRIQTTAEFAPPRGPMHVEVGDPVRVQAIEGCSQGILEAAPEIKERTTVNATRNGKTVSAPVWIADWFPEDPQYVRATWHTGTGLLLQWDDQEHYSGEGGRLVDTDAPLSEGDAATSAPDPDGWPDPGSYVNYRTDSLTLELTFRDGYWQGDCIPHGQPTLHVAFDPLRNPTDVKAGDHVQTWLYDDDCERSRMKVLVEGRYEEDTMKDGKPHTALAWWGDETNPEEADGIDRDAWWDTDTGLVLRWESPDDYPYTAGNATNTDAPLSNP